MSLRWIQQSPGSTFVSKSDNGYYGVAQVVAQYEGMHIEALWAKPTSLGYANDVRGAQQLCEQHAARAA